MHSAHVRDQVLKLVDAGVNDCEIARRTGLARTTVRDMRWSRDRPKANVCSTCPRCWRPVRPLRFSDEDYAELLGLYLGDGCISKGGRTYCLRISLDVKYPMIVRETKELLERCFPANAVGSLLAGPRRTTAVVWVYSAHLPCLFPQHGPGKKHERPLVLEDWQWQVVSRAPWRFLRGCIRSDGCVFVNRTGRYDYLSYDFSNLSADLLRFFTRACELVGADYRLYEPRPGLAARAGWTKAGSLRRGSVRINRRKSVELFVEHVGSKQ
jgi:hypothetical protein